MNPCGNKPWLEATCIQWIQFLIFKEKQILKIEIFNFTWKCYTVFNFPSISTSLTTEKPSFLLRIVLNFCLSQEHIWLEPQPSNYYCVTKWFFLYTGHHYCYLTLWSYEIQGPRWLTDYQRFIWCLTEQPPLLLTIKKEPISFSTCKNMAFCKSCLWPKWKFESWLCGKCSP